MGSGILVMSVPENFPTHFMVAPHYFRSCAGATAGRVKIWAKLFKTNDVVS